MIFRTPRLRADESDAIGSIEELWGKLRWRVASPRQWSGSLRRLTFSKSVQASNSIEGYHASVDDIVAVVENEPTRDTNDETQRAIAGYRDALTYVLQLADDANVVVDTSLIKSLHFMMMKDDLSKRPGRWRTGDVYVRREPTGEIVYEGPDADMVDGLMNEVVDEFGSHDGPVLVRAAMAHLNLVMVHPFKDGNGRMGRCLQTLVLANERIVSPVFSSIEEELGRSTEAYYSVLAEVGHGSWHPERDARPWVRFCLEAHYQQAQRVERRILETEELWDRCEALARERSVPMRAVGPMCDASRGMRVYNWLYRLAVEESEGDVIEPATATRDLNVLVERGLLLARGEARGRYYVGSDELRAVREEVRRSHSQRRFVRLFETPVQPPLPLAGDS